jgi:hypothetical protein
MSEAMYKNNFETILIVQCDLFKLYAAVINNQCHLVSMSVILLVSATTATTAAII